MICERRIALVAGQNGYPVSAKSVGEIHKVNLALILFPKLVLFRLFRISFQA